MWRQCFRKVPTGTKFTGQFHLPLKVLLVRKKSRYIGKRFFFSSSISQKSIHFTWSRSILFKKQNCTKTWFRGDSFLPGHLQLDFHCHLFVFFVIELRLHPHSSFRMKALTYLYVFAHHLNWNVRKCWDDNEEFSLRVGSAKQTNYVFKRKSSGYSLDEAWISYCGAYLTPTKVTQHTFCVLQRTSCEPWLIQHGERYERWETMFWRPQTPTVGSLWKNKSLPINVATGPHGISVLFD